jgi:hypothetical protein
LGRRTNINAESNWGPFCVDVFIFLKKVYRKLQMDLIKDNGVLACTVRDKKQLDSCILAKRLVRECAVVNTKRELLFLNVYNNLECVTAL